MKKKKDALYVVLCVIAVVTVVSGAVQAYVPAFVLGFIGGDPTPGNLLSFGIVGMFMVLFGGMLLHALINRRHHPVVVLWAGLQKFGASGAVGLGVMRGLFSSLALGVALFDLLSGCLILWYWLAIRRIR